MAWVVGPATDVVIRGLAAHHFPGVELLDTWEVADWYAEMEPVGVFVCWLRSGERRVLRPDERIFLRMVDVGRKLVGADASSQRSLFSALASWSDKIPAPVMNRLHVVTHNGSKPLHEHELSTLGLQIPESLTSSDPERLAAFAAQGPSIVKSLSGVRARARRVEPDDFRGRQFHGPVHVQRYVAGTDVRVHVVEATAYALAIEGTHVDYRHPDDADSTPISDGRPTEVPLSVRSSMFSASEAMGLPLTGWDFKVDYSGVWWCLEANPMPAFTPFDRPLGGAIAKRVAQWLTT
jgi:hypothetical protein